MPQRAIRGARVPTEERFRSSFLGLRAGGAVQTPSGADDELTIVRSTSVDEKRECGIAGVVDGAAAVDLGDATRQRLAVRQTPRYV